MKIDADILNDSDLIRVEIGGNTMFFAREELENVINVLEFWYIARNEVDEELAQLINVLSDIEV